MPPMHAVVGRQKAGGTVEDGSYYSRRKTDPDYFPSMMKYTPGQQYLVQVPVGGSLVWYQGYLVPWTSSYIQVPGTLVPGKK